MNEINADSWRCPDNLRGLSDLLRTQGLERGLDRVIVGVIVACALVELWREHNQH